MTNPDRRTQLDRLVDIWFARWERERISERGGRMHDAAIDPLLLDGLDGPDPFLAGVPANQMQEGDRA
ncbi:MAG: hypothetical protein OXN96_19215 [Bryobacterales bacterium]|nr:hypothetical protein [Bryobacterales bacterium]